MEKILIINGHEVFPFAEGKLNKTLFEETKKILQKKYNVKSSVLKEGYIIEDEIEKFIWADVIIFQHPIYWFGMPGLLKTYIDKIYQYGIFFEGAEEYGRGGLFREKKYMLSVTWNAPEDAFNDSKKFFEGKNIEEALFNLHKAHQFCGMQPIKTFSCNDVIKNPDINKYITNLKNHLKNEFNI